MDCRWCKGLSPRVWGSRLGFQEKVNLSWSIPTCVGQPHVAELGIVEEEVYPHVCGAATLQIIQITSVEGLSPRVWGSLGEQLDALGSVRSIPTCVGQPQ